MHEREKGSTPRYAVNVLLRALDLVRVLCDSGTGCTLQEVAAKAHLQKTTAYRILATLEKQGFVERSQERPIRYTPGLPWLVLAMKVTASGVVMARTQSVLEQVAASTDETAGLYVRWGKERICVASASSPYPPEYRVEVGVSASLCVGAAGKALLAYVRYEEARRIIEETLPVIQRYPGTPSQVDVLLEELEAVRRAGFAVSRAELSMGGTAVAVPIMSRNGSVVAAIGIAARADRVSEDRIPEIVTALRKGSEVLSRIPVFWSQESTVAPADDGDNEVDASVARRSPSQVS